MKLNFYNMVTLKQQSTKWQSPKISSYRYLIGFLALLVFITNGVGQTITTYDRSMWTVTPSSQELIADAPNGAATKMLDGNNATYWLSEITNNYAQYPHTLIFNMQAALPVNQIYYVPKDNPSTGAYAGIISFSDDGINFDTEISVIFSSAFSKHIINLPSTQTRQFFKITITQNYEDHDHANGNAITTMAEVGAIYDTSFDNSLASFAITPEVGGVKLDWSTAYENNSASFNIMRSDDAVNFTQIGNIIASGNTSIATNYSFTDLTPINGINFYRLDLVHTSGPNELSRLKNAEFPLVAYSSTQSKNLNVFYFIPAGKAAYPNFKSRLDGVFLGLQGYYRNEMQRIGRGPKTFSLLTDATHTKVKMIVVHGKYPFATYTRDTGGVGAIQAEIDAYIAANPSPYYSSHNLTVTPAFGYDPVTGIVDEQVPVVGNGKNCYTLDYPALRWDLLGVVSPEGEAATVNIGGTAHEAGHSLGLYHNGLRATEPELGEALMRGGNYTFGKATTSLTPADASILNRNQVFNPDGITYYGPNKAIITSIHACYSASKNAIIVAGRTSTSGSPVTDVSIYQDSNNDPFAPGMGTNKDYDAVTWTAPVVATDTFYVEMPVSGLFVKDSSLYEMKILLIQQDGNTSDIYYHFNFANNIPEMKDMAFKPILNTITASAGLHGTISQSGPTVINCVSNQTYTITPDAGYIIDKLLVDGVPVTPTGARVMANSAEPTASSTFTFNNVNAPHTISATFIEAVLPVTLISFEAKANTQNQAQLKWETADEVNLEKFEIEKSVDAASFKTIGQVKATGENNYNYLDETQIEKVNYYRLKMVDLDGKFKYSNIQAVNSIQTEPFALYPNPAKDQITIELNNPNFSLDLLDATGKNVFNKANLANKATISTKDLATGLYFVKVQSADGKYNISKKVSVVK